MAVASRRKVLMQSLFALSAPALSGVLLGLALRFDALAPLGWIALVPLVWTCASQLPLLELVLGAFLGGMILHGLGLEWIRTSDQGVGVSGPHAVSWFLMALYGGAWWGASAVALRWTRRSLRWPMLVSVPVVWLVQEAGRKQIFCLIAGSAFPWLQLGVTQAGASAVQWAELGGMSLVSAVLALANACAAGVGLELGLRLDRFRRLRVIGHLAMILLLLAGSRVYASSRTARLRGDRAVSVCCVPSPCRPEHLGKQPEWMAEIAAADFALWPESSLPGLLDRRGGAPPDARLSHLQRLADRTATTLLVGCDCLAERGKMRSTLVVRPGHDELAYYDKVGLVPWSEFHPPVAIAGITPRSAGYSRGKHFPSFDCAMRNGRRVRVATIICYDACFPEVLRAIFRQAGAAASPELLLASSAEVADGSGVLQRAMLQMTRCRAVETRRSIVRCVDGGITAVVDASGHLIDRAPQTILTRVWTARAVPIRLPTPYMRYGDWPTWAAEILAGVALAFCCLHRMLRC